MILLLDIYFNKVTNIVDIVCCASNYNNKWYGGKLT
jgi:hypothetical protein